MPKVKAMTPSAVWPQPAFRATFQRCEAAQEPDGKAPYSAQQNLAGTKRAQLWFLCPQNALKAYNSH